MIFRSENILWNLEMKIVVKYFLDNLVLLNLKSFAANKQVSMQSVEWRISIWWCTKIEFTSIKNHNLKWHFKVLREKKLNEIIEFSIIHRDRNHLLRNIKCPKSIEIHPTIKL